MASTKKQLRSLTCQIWLWVIDRNITISAEFLPGRLNKVADEQSRLKENLDAERMLKQNIFQQLRLKIWASWNWCIGIPNQFSAITLCIMEARSSSRGHWCISQRTGVTHFIWFSSFQLNSLDAAEDSTQPCPHLSDNSTVADPNVVHDSTIDDNSATYDSPMRSANLTAGPPETTGPPGQIASPGCHATIRDSFRVAGISEQVIDILAKLWRTGTNAQYRTYLERWLQFCSKNQINVISPSINLVLGFLHEQYASELGYNSVDTAHSTLSTIIVTDSMPVGQHPLIRQLMEGILYKRPSLPRN